MNPIYRSYIPALLVSVIVSLSCTSRIATGDDKQPLVLAHYMPWYQAKPASSIWGWHWTMNKFDPDHLIDGRRAIASHLYPLIGPYDSGDPAVLEYQLLTMKLAGIDGVIIDWYGSQDFLDYGTIHRATQQLVAMIRRHDMKFAICFENRIVGKFEEAGRLPASRRVDHVAKEIAWLARHWFTLKNYVRLDGRPVLLGFGQKGLTDQEWNRVIQASPVPIAYVSQHYRRPMAVGAFDWPIPAEGMNAIKRFHASARDWPVSIPVAFPRFKDIYEQAGVHASWGTIADGNGKTFRDTFRAAIKSNQRIIQLATWNDWGEGTSIEPSREYGYRDLETIQSFRRQRLDAKFTFATDDLRLPYRLLELRRRIPRGTSSKELDRIANLISTGELRKAATAIKAASARE